MSYEPYPAPPPSPYGYGAPGPVGDPRYAPLPGATIGQAVQRFFQRYAQFRGRASRSEYWWWTLVSALVSVVFDVLVRASSLFFILDLIWVLAVLVPSIALVARRLHDVNRSGWWQFLVLIPIVGWIILLVWFCTDSKPEGARFDA